MSSHDGDVRRDQPTAPHRPPARDRARTSAALAAAVLVVAALVVAIGRGAPQPTLEPADDTSRAHTEGYAVWARNDDGRPVRWDPCRSVVLVVEPTGAPPGGEDDLAEAVEQLRAVTGLDLVIAGRVDERPAADRPPYQPQRYGENWAPVLVAWARPHEADLPLRDWDRGVAIPIAAGPRGAQVFVTGQVVLNVERDDLVAGFDDRATAWGATILHELMHLLGLDHVDDPDELMWTFPGEGPVQLGPGDLAGLRAVGAPHDSTGETTADPSADTTSGCLDVPPARDVEVVGTPGG